MTIHSLPQRIVYTMAIRICGGEILVNHTVEGKRWDIVIPDILTVVRAKISFDDDEGWVDLGVEDFSDGQGRSWMSIIMDGGHLIERDRKFIEKLANILRARVEEFDDEDVDSFDWSDEDDADWIPSLRMEDLLLPHSSSGADTGVRPIERMDDEQSPKTLPVSMHAGPVLSLSNITAGVMSSSFSFQAGYDFN